MNTSATVLTGEQLHELGGVLGDSLESRKHAFIDAAVQDLAFPYSSAEHDVAVVVERLRHLESIEPWIRGRTPICLDDQEVALLLPYNVVSWAVWDCACLFAAGNRVRVRFSKRAGRIAELAEATMRDLVFGDVRVVDDPGPEFVDDVLGSDQVPLLIAYGSERLGDGLLHRASGHEGKKIVFEGPGKDPAIVLEGADASAAAAVISASKFEFSGQQCIAPEIVLCHSTLHDEVVDHLVNAFRNVHFGDPADPATQVGPIASARVPEMIRQQLADAEERGADIAWGGDVSNDWVSPTIVVNVNRDMAIFQEESFGPVIAVLSVSDGDEALSLARSTRFGLNCMLFGPGAESYAAKLRGELYATRTTELLYGKFGTTSVDGPLFSEPGAGLEPFGGYGKSGWIYDSGNLLQGPKLFAREACRETPTAQA